VLIEWLPEYLPQTIGKGKGKAKVEWVFDDIHLLSSLPTLSPDDRLLEVGTL
jgi:hypothetical protein